MGTTQNPGRANEIASLLKQADKLVKEENLAEALDLIRQAQSYNPRNLYAMAYEERVKALLNERIEDDKKNASSPQEISENPAKVADASSRSVPATLPSFVGTNSRNGTAETKTVSQKSTVVKPPLQYLSNLAVIEAQRGPAHAVAQERSWAGEIQTAESQGNGALQTPPPVQPSADTDKVEVFRTRAFSFYEKKEYNRALDEITRAYLLDPENEKIRALEEKVREAIELQQRARAEEQEERMHQRNNEEKLKTALEAAEKQKAEERQRIALEEKITVFLNRAVAFSEKKEYNRALDEIARAYLFDPANEKILELEEKIRKMQDEALHDNEEERRGAATQDHKNIPQLSDEERYLLNLPRVDVRTTKKNNAPQTTAHNRIGDIGSCLQRVRELFAANRLEEALSELAFVIILDPLNEEVLKLEQQIIEKQEQRQHWQLEQYRKQLDERLKRRQAMIAAIQLLAKERKNSDALRTIARSVVLDPISEELREYNL